MHLLLTLALATQLTAGRGELLLNPGDRAPPFAMRDLKRTIFSIRDHAGPKAKDPKKAIVLVFFATWCKPCMKEIPIIKRIHRSWRGKQVEVAYVGLSQGAKELSPFAKKQKLPWRVVPDSFGLLARRYGASQLPHLFIIDKDGKIAFQHRGISSNLKKTLDTQLATITGEKAPTDEEPAVVDQPRFDTTYVLGRAPSGKGSAARWQPLGAFVGEAVDANVDVATEGSYEEFEKALKAGKYDLANAGPYLCHEVREAYEPIAKVERQESPTYFGIIFTLRKSPIRSLADLKGKTIGLVDERSTSGGLYAKLALIEAGLKPDTDLKIEWLGAHSKVAEAVKAGRVDAGGCFEDCRDWAWPSARAKNSSTRVITYTAEIPAEMILVKRTLDSGTKKGLKIAVLGLTNAEGILQQISQGETTVTAVVEASESDLEKVHETIEKVTGKGGH